MSRKDVTQEMLSEYVRSQDVKPKMLSEYAKPKMSAEYLRSYKRRHGFDKEDERKQPNQKQSRLMSLPGELRNQIYQYLLTSSDLYIHPAVAGPRLLYPTKSDVAKMNENNNAVMSIHSVCLQTHRETFSLFPKFCNVIAS